MDTKRKLFIIGGRSMLKKECLMFDRRIIEMTGRKRPNVLYIPSASDDNPELCDIFDSVYKDIFKCKVERLLVMSNPPSRGAIQKMIAEANVLFVGGGNTLRMMRRWRFLGIDKMLIKACKLGVVCAGVSAGGICWFEYGHSDSMSFYANPDWKYIKVRGLGMLPGIHCPHYNSQTKGRRRRASFKKFIRTKNDFGLAVDNHAAIEFRDGIYRVHSGRPKSWVYRVGKKNDRVVAKRFPETGLSNQ